MIAAPHYLEWGVVQISLGNLLVIVAMIVVFVLALLLPFPGRRAGASGDRHGRRPERGRHRQLDRRGCATG